MVACIVLLFSLFCLGLAYEEIIDTGGESVARTLSPGSCGLIFPSCRTVSQKRSTGELFLGPAQSNILPVRPKRLAPPARVSWHFVPDPWLQIADFDRPHDHDLSILSDGESSGREPRARCTSRYKCEPG